jgi:thymidine kinase
MPKNNTYSGFIRLYMGPMFSGKTSALLEAYTRHTIAKRKCLLVKYIGDTRYDVKNIVSHDGKKIESSCNCKLLYEIDNIVNNYQVICIDEIQFFQDAPIFCDKWANEGLIVELAGLSGTYLREEFPVISQLIPLAEEIHKKTAICVQTGKDAQYTFRLSDDNTTVVIGGLDKYTPMDRVTFFENSQPDKILNYHKNNFRKFAEIYCSANKITIDYDVLMDFFTTNFNHQTSYVQIIKNFFEI